MGILNFAEYTQLSDKDGKREPRKTNEMLFMLPLKENRMEKQNE